MTIERELVKIVQLRVGDEFQFVTRDARGNIVAPSGDKFYTVLDRQKLGEATLRLSMRSSTNSGIIHRFFARTIEVMVAR